MKKIRFQFIRNEASGRRKGWGKWIVNFDPSQEGLRQFKGEFIPNGTTIEVEEGRLFVSCGFDGSAKYSSNIYQVCKTKDKGGDDPRFNYELLEKFDTRTQFPDFVEFVKEQLQGKEMAGEIEEEDIKRVKEAFADDPVLLQKLLKKLSN